MSAPSREIILGVGGGIAAYKACDLLRRLQDRGYSITVVPTPSSLNFVGKATWEALSGRKVTTQVWESVEEIRHIALADQAEAILIAPATADLIARIAMGRADDLLTNILLATRAPIFVVPAMHTAMWENPATQKNVETLRNRGIHVMEPSTGALTSGDVGKGRFPESAEIVEEFEATLSPRDLEGRKVLVSAGGTREAIDPVRFIGNRSSGIQGLAIAEAARLRGAEVTLVIANSSLPSHPDIRRVDVETVAQMNEGLKNHFIDSDLLVMAAAVSDVRPSNLSDEKIKKEDLTSLFLERNIDILENLSASKSHQLVVAFAAESDRDSVQAAQEKMARKGADLIYLNNISNGAIFGSPQTSGKIIDKSGVLEELSDVSKNSMAHTLLNHVVHRLNKLR